MKAWIVCIALIGIAVGNQRGWAQEQIPAKPNIVFIMSDELAYYELSHMGNPRIRTPNIDRMAKEGIRFTQALAAAPVCAPLRACLMTGKHMGHCSVRANDGGTPLRANEATIASMLKSQGYATGGFGKWGAGGRGSTGVPEVHGFDVFYGYYDQVHAHSFYPPYLVRNSVEVPLEGNIGGRSGKSYSHYSIMNEGLDFIREHKDEPFFCYFPITPPHGMYDIPDSDRAWKQYQADDWMKDPEVPQDAKNYAAMVTMVDNDLGEVLELLRELSLEDNTIVFFTGDNGGQDRFKSPQYPRGYFGPNVNPKDGSDLRGQKGTLYEGGLRIPFLVRWPNKIQAGQVSDLLFSQVDMLPTLADLAKAEVPEDADGLSILPTLLGADVAGQEQQQHEMLYWEYGKQTAVRAGHWKAIQPTKGADWELYDLRQDLTETEDIASAHPELLARMKKFAAASHTPVQPGTFSDRTNHEKDRQAKWGTSGSAPPRKGTTSRLKHKQLIPAKSLKLARYSSQNEGNGRLARFALDQDPNTIWHTQFMPTVAKHPHRLVIDLGETRNIQGIQYLARQDGGWNGAFRDIEVRAGDDLESLDSVLRHRMNKTRAPQTALFDQPTAARFVEIVILSEVNGGPWASAADLGILAAE